jgi:hypothetical protein
MSKRQDNDLKSMTVGDLRRLVMRLRTGIRRHRDAEENERCWHNDLALYGQLPEGKPPGRMVGPERILLRNCKRYIRRQKCHVDCPLRRT